MLLGLLAQALPADGPAPKANDEGKPPYQRLLKGADSQRADELQQQIDELWVKGAFAEAVKPAEQLWRLRRRRQGKDHWQAISAKWLLEAIRAAGGRPAEQRRQLAGIFLKAQQAEALKAAARYREEEALRQRLVATLRKVLGDDSPETAYAYNNLASCQRAQGRYAEAERASWRALTVWRRALGEQHPDTAQAFNNLALCRQDLGRYAEAEQDFRQALKIWRKALGEENPDTAAAYNNLASCQHDRGHYEEAERGFRRALRIVRKARGDEDPDTAGAYNNLAFCEQDLGRYEEAEHGFRQALAIVRRALGEGHPFTAGAYNNLASCQQARGRYAEAEHGYRQALKIRRRALGEEHPDTAESYNNLALCQWTWGRYAEAEGGFRRALAIWHQAFGDEHPATTTAFNNLASCQRALGHYAEAERGYRRALAIRRKALGEEHPATATAYNNLAGCQRAWGHFEEAERGYRRALKIRRRALGEEHPDTATTYNNLARCKYDQGIYDRAEELFARAATVYRVARLRAAPGLGRAALSDRSPLPWLAALLARAGKPGEAWRRYEEGLGRSTADELAARLRRTPEERRRHTELVVRLDRLDRALADLSLTDLAAEQEAQRRQLLAEQRKGLEELQALSDELERRYGVGEGRFYRLAQVQARLPADAALVGWVDLKSHPRAKDPGGEHWGVVVRAKGPPAWARLPGSGPNGAWTADDDRLPGRLLQELIRRSRPAAAGWRGLARRLARQRLRPLEEYLAARDGLPAARRLVVLPSELMDEIPLGVLADRFICSRCPSGSLYAYLRGLPRPAGRGLLAVADPAFGRPEEPEPPLPPGGVLVTRLEPGSAAARAGLRPGDVLLRYGATKLARPADLKERPEADGPAKAVEVEVWRDGRTLKGRVPPGRLGVLLADQPAPEALAGLHKLDRLLAARGKDGRGWPPLPGTRLEAAALRDLFAKRKEPVALLTGAEATGRRLAGLLQEGRRGGARYLHFATHGTYDPRFPLQSAVILAPEPQPGEPPEDPGPAPDGELTAAEVLRHWRLDADLVTLSACETALGKYERGEGFMGFAQAVLLTGGRSVCLSLWRVDDTATALLMQRLYQNLLGARQGLKGPLPKAEALAEAQKWLRSLTRAEASRLAAGLAAGAARAKGRPARPLLPPVEAPKGDGDRPYGHPYYWAAFVLVGDPG